ncbi:MAG TPA: hypothetical protein VGD80_16205, partial [Kofleriaceae bacterium]
PRPAPTSRPPRPPIGLAVGRIGGFPSELIGVAELRLAGWMGKPLGDLEKRLQGALAGHARAYDESMRGLIAVIDEKYADLPGRMKRLEAVVFPAEQR